MKRRNLVMTFMLVAALILGVGYAAVTDVLDINGTADVNPDTAFNEDIYFSAAVANQAGNTASVVDTDPDMANFTVSTLSGMNDEATFTFTIKNAGDLDVIVTPTVAQDGNNHPEYFELFSDWDGQPKEIEAGTELTYTLTVKLKATPADTLHGVFHIELSATPVSAPAQNG